MSLNYEPSSEPIHIPANCFRRCLNPPMIYQGRSIPDPPDMFNKREIVCNKRFLQQTRNRLVSGTVSISHQLCKRDRARQIQELFRKRQVPNARRIHPRTLPSHLRLSRPSQRSQGTARLPNSGLVRVSLPEFCTIALFKLPEHDFLLPL